MKKTQEKTENGRIGEMDLQCPYDPGEIRIIRHFCELTDREFTAKKQ